MALKKLYKYTARDISGIAISGRVEAESAKAVSHSLKELGYIVVSIDETKTRKLDLIGNMRSRFFAVTSNDVLLFFRQMATMTGAGLPLLNALGNIIDQVKNIHFKKILIDIASEVRGGKSFSEALSHYPRLFTRFHINMIKAGETGGMLPEVVERLASIGYEERELKGKLQSAFAYPVLLVSISMVIVIALLTFVLPKFTGIFQESAVRLPLPTAVLLFVSDALRKFWYLPLIFLGATTFYMQRRYASEKGRYYIHKRILSLPILGNVILIIAVSRFCKIMAALIKSGIPLLEALSVSEGLLGNKVLSNAVSHIKQAVVEGTALSESLKVTGIFPSMMVQMVAVGESTGKLEEMLFHVGDFYDKESALFIRTMTTLIEPVLLLFMGLIVGFIALSVLLPIFNLVKVLKH